MAAAVGGLFVGARVKRSALPLCAFLLPLSFLGAFFLYPLLRLLVLGMASATEVSPWTDLFFWHTVAFTYGQAALSALTSGLVGITGALLYSEQRFRGRRFFFRLGLVCFSLPSILVVLAISALWGNRITGLTAILIAHTFFNFALYLKGVGTALVELDRSMEMAALSLGASRVACFFRVTVPRILPAVRSAFFLSFLYSAMSFLVVLMLGGGPRLTSLEVAIYQAIKIDFDLPLASRLALVQMVVALVIYAVFLRAPREIPRRESARWAPLYLFRNANINRLALGIYFTVFFLIAGLPLVSLLASAISTLDQIHWGEAASAIGTSLVLGFTVALASSVIAFCLAHTERQSGSRVLRESAAFLGTLPLSVSSMVLALGLILTFPSWQAGSQGKFAAIVLVQVTLALPLVVRPLRDGLFRIPSSLFRAARSLGAGPWRTLFHVELPVMRRSVMLALIFGLAFSLGEVGSVLIFLSVDRNTLPLWIYRLMARYRFEEAYPAGGILIAVMGVVYAFTSEGGD